jgi:hypothetical protein
MKLFSLGAAATLGALAIVTPADAVVTTFASFNAANNANIVFLNNGTGGSQNTYRSNGFGGRLVTRSSIPANLNSISYAAPSSAQGVNVTFSFLQSALSSISNVAATFTLDLAASVAPVSGNAFKSIEGLNGTFSFLSKNAITINGQTFAAGSNLLTGVVGGPVAGAIGGLNASTSGALVGATSAGGTTITYTSDFLSFVPTVDRDFSISLSAITSLLTATTNGGLNNASGRSFRSFKATATGSFSTDPAPLVTVSPVPEVATWGLMLVGFGGIGAALRSRRTARVAFSA